MERQPLYARRLRGAPLLNFAAHEVDPTPMPVAHDQDEAKPGPAAGAALTSRAPSPGAAPNEQTPALPAAARRALARALRRRRAELVARWYAGQFEASRLERYAVAGIDGHDPAEMQRHFVGPLLDLLLALIDTGEDRYLDVYLDERLRYAPHHDTPERRAAFFEEVLPGDEAALLELAGDGPTREALAGFLSALHEPLRRPGGGAPLRLLALGDCLMNELRVFLPRRARERGIALDMRCLYFSAAVGRDLGVDAVLRFLETNPADLIAASFLSYEGLPLYPALLRSAASLSEAELARRVDGLLAAVRGFLAGLRAHSDAPFLVHDASGLPLDGLRRRLPLVHPLGAARMRALRALNAGLRALVDELPNALPVDEAGVAEAAGLRRCARDVVPRWIARDAWFHTARLGVELVPPYLDLLDSFRVLRKAKVLCVDFDHTLWDGVMADGAVRHHAGRQALLRRLREHGMLLVAVSKNDPRNVRWDELELGPDDFVLHKIGWNLKVQSIQEAAAELDLGQDAFVMVDDSPEERAMVASRLPAVATLDADDPRTWRWLERLLRFPNTRDTGEAMARTRLYREQARRREALAVEQDYPALMAELGLVARFGPARRGDLGRVAELVARTNQFNTTTIRYPRRELEARLAGDRHRVYVAELSDKFGSLGLVGVVVIERDADTAVFEAVVMSCRAMGFGLERLLVRCVLDAEVGVRRFVGRFVPTDRNAPASGLYRECGFREDGPHAWVLERGDPEPERPEWLALAAR